MSAVLEYLESVKPEKKHNQGENRDATDNTSTEWEKLVSQLVDIMPKLTSGLDCIPNFTDPEIFESNIATILFSALRIRLFHLWVVDHEKEKPIFEVLCNRSYDDLQVFLADYSSGRLEEDEATEALLAKNWLSNTAHQSTEYGVQKLLALMNEHELGVLYKNGHYSVIIKRRNRLYSLATADSLCERHPQIVWESIPETAAEMNGVGEYCDCNFFPFRALSA